MEDIFAVAKSEAGRAFPGLSLLPAFHALVGGPAAPLEPAAADVEAFAVAPLQPRAPTTPLRDGAGGRTASIVAGRSGSVAGRTASISTGPGLVGLRPPQNPHRGNVVLFGPTTTTTGGGGDATLATASLVTLYEYYAPQFQIKPNSRVLQLLKQQQQHAGTAPPPHDPTSSASPSLVFNDITALNLAQCAFKDRGLLPILELLRHLPQLQSLILPQNDISNEGVEWLAHALALSPAGEAIAVSNATSSVFAPALMQQFVCPALATLDLSGNGKMGIGGTRLLSDLAALRASVTAITLDGMKIEASERRRMERFLLANKTKTAKKE